MPPIFFFSFFVWFVFLRSLSPPHEHLPKDDLEKIKLCLPKGNQKNWKIIFEKKCNCQKKLVQKVNRIFGLPQFVWPTENLVWLNFGLSTARCSFQVTHSSPLLLYCPLIPTLLRCIHVEFMYFYCKGLRTPSSEGVKRAAFFAAAGNLVLCF